MKLFSEIINNDAQIFVNAKNGLQFIDISREAKPSLQNNKVISLFTGAGGLDIGLEKAGFDTAECVEIDADCRETLRHNRPNWKLFEDETGGRKAGDFNKIQPDNFRRKNQYFTFPPYDWNQVVRADNLIQ